MNHTRNQQNCSISEKMVEINTLQRMNWQMFFLEFFYIIFEWFSKSFHNKRKMSYQSADSLNLKESDCSCENYRPNIFRNYLLLFVQLRFLLHFIVKKLSSPKSCSKRCSNEHIRTSVLLPGGHPTSDEMNVKIEQRL